MRYRAVVYREDQIEDQSDNIHARYEDALEDLTILREETAKEVALRVLQPVVYHIQDVGTFEQQFENYDFCIQHIW
jgi:hypothetical protein